MSRSVPIIDPAVLTDDRDQFIRENAVALVRTLEAQLVRLRKRLRRVEQSRDCLHDALSVANYFLDKGAETGVPIDPLKLQKLVYFAHGWHLAVTGQPLFWQTVLAWPYGPVIRDVYDEFKGYGRRPIDGRATTLDPDTFEAHPVTGSFGPITQSVLEHVWQVYKGYTGLQLSAMAHNEGTPWHQKVGNLKPSERRDVPIPNELIRQHYLQLAKTTD